MVQKKYGMNTVIVDIMGLKMNTNLSFPIKSNLQEWHDARFIWNVTDNQFPSISIPADKIWHPDIVCVQR